MILTVTLNAAVDKTYRVENFALDRVHRPSEWRVAAGGKGINVARVFHTLGGNVVATGFLGGHNGRQIRESLLQEGIPAEFVQTQGESRLCIAIVDPIASTQTEINEPGPNIRPEEVAAFRSIFSRLIEEYRFCYIVLSGSLPPGVPVTIYADLIHMARAQNVPCVLDASGEALRHGLEAHPWMVKPNRFELAALCDRESLTSSEIISFARKLAGTGAEIVAVTLGREGCICAAAGSIWMAKPTPIRFVSAVGSGDAFVGAFVWALEQGGEIPEALRLGVGAGSANAEVYGAGFCSAEHIHKNAAGVTLERLTSE